MAKRLKEVPKTKLVSITILEDWWEAAAKLAKSAAPIDRNWFEICFMRRFRNRTD